MKKKLLLSILFLMLSVVFCFSYTFAANNPVDSVRNVVGGAENAIEGAAKGITNGIRSGVNTVEHAGQNTTNMVTNNSAKNNSMTSGLLTDNNSNGNYTAQRTTTRTVTNATNGTFLGMTSTAWTWAIMALLAIVIITLVWFYGKQFTHNSHNSDTNY